MEKIYDSIGEARYRQLMKKAWQTNSIRDKQEKKYGLATPDQGAFSLQLRTAMCAFACGIDTEDWNAVAEGQAMLEKIELKLRSIEKDSNTIILN